MKNARTTTHTSPPAGSPSQKLTERDRVERLVAANLDDLLGYFARRLDPDDAADALSDTLTVLWRRAVHTPDDATAARMWAFGVARNVVRTHRRTTGRRAALVQLLGNELAATSTSTPSDTSLDSLGPAIEALNPLDREIIRLVHWEGFALTDVATILDKNDTTVRSRYHRARQRLKKHIETTRMRPGDHAGPWP